MRVRALCLVPLLATSGCLFAAGTPPVRASVGASSRVSPGHAEVRPDLRVGVYPTQMIEQTRVHAGAGVLLSPGETNRDALFVDIGARVLRRRFRRAEASLSIDALGRIEHEDGHTGYGLALQALGERVIFVDRSGCAAHAFFTRAYGDGAVGWFVEAATGRVQGAPFTAATLGLSMRLPAAGVFGMEHGKC